jgi:tetratricopeptide (TPR) repeat protein
MPNDPGWTQPQPWLVLAAMALSGGDCLASLTTAEGILERLPADEQVPARLAAALIRLALSRRTGDLAAAAAAAGRSEALSGQLPQGLCARHPEFQAQVVTAGGAVDLWAGKLDEAAGRFEVATSAAPPAGYERADALAYLALAEALRGRLSAAVARARQAAEAMGSGGGDDDEDLNEHIIPGADVALAWVSLQRGDTQEAHARLKLAEPALRLCPDKLVSALACTVAASAAWPRGRRPPPWR